MRDATSTNEEAIFPISLSLSPRALRELFFTLHPPREQKIPANKNIELYTLKIHFVKRRETKRGAEKSCLP